MRDKSTGKTGTVYRLRRDLIFSPNITKRKILKKLSLLLLAKLQMGHVKQNAMVRVQEMLKQVSIVIALPLYE